MSTKKTRSSARLPLLHRWSPRQVFLADAFGALLTATILGLALPLLTSHLGMPKTYLYILAAIVLGFFLYSLSIYWIRPKRWVTYLRLIAVANASYCILTLSLLYQLREAVTLLGTVYFIGEALLIFAIALLEWSYANGYDDRGFG